MGFKRAGFEIEEGIDNWPTALKTFSKYIDAPGREIGIQDYFPSKKDFDAIIVGGTPCQDFSVANKKRNVYGKRAQLVLDFCRIVKAIKPEVFVFENVVHLPRWAEYAVLDIPGYKVTKNMVDSAYFGVPQHRRRKIFLGSRRRTIGLPTPQVSEFPTVRQAFEGMGENWGFTKHKPETVERFKSITSTSWISGTGTSEYAGTVRLAWDKPAVAVTNVKKFYILHPELDRAISIAEALALQGFPIWYIPCGPDSHKAVQVANAVPPSLAYNIARTIKTRMN